MRNFKRILVFLLAIALIFGFAACGGKKDSAAPTDAPELEPAATPQEEPAKEPGPEVEEEATVTYPLVEETLELSIFFMSNPVVVEAMEDTRNNAAFRVAEEATGIHIVSRGVMPWVAADEFNIMIAAEEYTDFIAQFGSLYTQGYDHAIEEGVIHDLKDLIPTCAPDWLRALDAYEDGVKACNTEGGHMPEISSIAKVPNRVENGLWIRADWLEKLGLDRPVTYDDLEEALLGFKTEFGSKGILMMGTGVMGDNWLASGFGINAYQVVGFLSEYAFYQVENEVRHGWVQPEFKDYLTLMNKWYNMGLIHPDTILMPADWNNPENDKYKTTGEVGLWYGSMSGAAAIERASTDPDCKVAAITDPVLKEGDITHFQLTPDNFGLGSGCCITTAVEDVEVALKWLNWWFTEEGYLAANYGEEGTTYTMVNGEPKYTELIMNDERGAFMAWNVHCNNTTGIYGNGEKLDDIYAPNELEAVKIWMSGSDNAYRYPAAATLNAEEGSRFNQIMAEVNTYGSENIIKFIIGQRPLDEFEQFVDQLYAMEIQETIDLKQAALNRYLAR
ncbi:MAG: extracellular solute-binding protein [Oscillospiraceae bacterium]|jgi:putative aldouronate transport system substrate-binding protein